MIAGLKYGTGVKFSSLVMGIVNGVPFQVVPAGSLAHSALTVKLPFDWAARSGAMSAAIEQTSSPQTSQLHRAASSALAQLMPTSGGLAASQLCTSPMIRSP